jgi:predicted transcriptional regulator of viral defense system
MGNKEGKLIRFIKNKGGLATYAEIVKAGFNKTLLKLCLDSKRIQRLDRGLYSFPEGSSLPHPDLAAVSIKVPRGVICLLSALSFHEATTEIPRYVDVAIPRGAHANRIKYPPVRFYRFTRKAWESGIEEKDIEGYRIRVYNLAKTVADCFKFRNQIGMDVARAALKAAVREKKANPNDIMRYAKVCRVHNIIKPILEAVL